MNRPPVPQQHPDEGAHRRLLAEAVNLLLRGKSNNVFDVTLADSAATTTVTNNLITVGSVLHFMPTTANAAAEQGAGTMYVSSTGRLNGSTVITHANNAQTDRTFKVSVVG